jgi:hypothetical protein
MPEKNWAAPLVTENGPDIDKCNIKSTRRAVPHKWQRVLRALLEAPRTTRELERPPVFDHVGHSTAAELRKMGIVLHTEIVTIDGYSGEPARVARYSVAPESRELAARLVGYVP